MGVGGGIVMYTPCIEKRQRLIDCGVGVLAGLFGAERGC